MTVTMRIIHCIGGSLTAGVRTTRGYPEHLYELLDGETVVVNGGIVGATAVDVMRGLPVSGHAGAVVVLVGTYDARGGGPPPREYRAILRQLVGHCVALFACPVLLCTPPPMTGSTIKGFNRPARRWVGKAVTAAVELSESIPGVELVRLDDMPEDMLADGVHPNPSGYRWIAERVAKVVRELS